MEEFISQWNKVKENQNDDNSFDDTPFSRLYSRDKPKYDEFLKGLLENDIPHVDTYIDGGGCIMVYPQPNIGLSCIFSVIGDAVIEIQITRSSKNCFIANVKEYGFGEYDEEYRLLRNNNIQNALLWIYSLK